MPSRSFGWSVGRVSVGCLVFVAACGVPEAYRASELDAGGTGGGLVPGGFGGVIGSGGSTGTRGGVGGGGVIGTGGISGTGGVIGTGGRVGSGGAIGSGGRLGSGGAIGSGGMLGTGGVIGTGGRVGSGGATGSGGVTGTGGVVGSGGAVGTGGAGMGGAGGALFSDDFETGSSSRWTTTTAGDWSVVSDGTMVYKEGATVSSVTRLATVTSVPGAGNDMVVEAALKVLQFPGQSTSYQAEVCARFVDSSTYYYAALDSTGKVAIKKNSATASNMTLASVADGIVTNTWYTVKFQVVGSTLTAFVNGVQKVTTTDTEIASGGIALGTRNAIVEFDNVRVTLP